MSLPRVGDPRPSSLLDYLGVPPQGLQPASGQTSDPPAAVALSVISTASPVCWGLGGLVRPLGVAQLALWGPKVPPPGPGGSTRHFWSQRRPEVCGAQPAPPLPRSLAGGAGGAGGDTALPCSCRQLLRLSLPLPFLGKVERWPSARPAVSHLPASSSVAKVKPGSGRFLVPPPAPGVLLGLAAGTPAPTVTAVVGMGRA